MSAPRLHLRWLQPSVGLLLVLALTLALYPFADETRSLRALAQILDIAVVLSVLRMLRVHHLWLRGGWAVSIPLVLLQLAHLLWPGLVLLQMPMLIAQIAFHGYAVILLLGYVLRDEAARQSGHAWAEAHVEALGWVGFDVSNRISPDERYVRVATGRDYREAAPVTGLSWGAGETRLAVKLAVEQQSQEQ